MEKYYADLEGTTLTTYDMLKKFVNKEGYLYLITKAYGLTEDWIALADDETNAKTLAQFEFNLMCPEDQEVTTIRVERYKFEDIEFDEDMNIAQWDSEVVYRL